MGGGSRSAVRRALAGRRGDAIFRGVARIEKIAERESRNGHESRPCARALTIRELIHSFYIHMPILSYLY